MIKYNRYASFIMLGTLLLLAGCASECHCPDCPAPTVITK